MKKYICPELEYVMMDSDDVITTSTIVAVEDAAGNPISINWYTT